MSVPRPYRLLEQPSAAAEFADQLRCEPVLAFDLEADSLHSYREKICLVQVSTPSIDGILDPLAVPGLLGRLSPVLASPASRKVFHGGDYDVRLLKREGVAEVKGVFDTMIAAQLAGRERYGLAALLEAEFSVVLDKRYQRADWSRRPLEPGMLAYAAADTAHLLALAERLTEELTRLGRLAWAEEEFRLLEQVEPSVPKRPWCLDVKGASRLAPRQLARLQALLELRDEVAAASNRPPFKVLANQTLLDWASRPPASRREVVATPGAGAALLERIATRVVDALARAEQVPEDQCPRVETARRTPLTPDQDRRLARLRSAREGVAGVLRIDVGLLVNGATLETLARREPQEAEASLPTLLKRWQLVAVGDALRHALAL